MNYRSRTSMIRHHTAAVSGEKNLGIACRTPLGTLSTAPSVHSAREEQAEAKRPA